MKSVLTFVIAMLFLACLTAAAAPADDKKTVAHLDTEYQAAVKTNDAATMDRILADDFILVDGEGTVSTKADLIKEARSRRITYEHQEELEQAVRLWEDTAIVTAKLWGKGTDGGKPFEWRLWFSDTYVRTPKGWRYAFGQASLPLHQTSSHHVHVPIVPARPEDVGTIDEIVKASYDVISGPVGTPRQWRSLSLCDPEALFVGAGAEPDTKDLKPRRWTHQQFVEFLDDYMVKTGYEYRALGCSTKRCGHAATVLCGFEGKEQSKVVERGVEIIQLYNDGTRWWILSSVWDHESPDNPIPTELLAKQ